MGMMAADKKSFVLYHDIRTPLELLTDEQRGKLFIALLNYSEHGELPDFDGALLVLDDLGAERDTAYAAEQVFNVVDARVQTGLPLIVTTNLSVAEMQQADSMQLKRIYDRVLELCPVRIKLEGESRRTQNAQQRLAVANDLLKPSART